MENSEEWEVEKTVPHITSMSILALVHWDYLLLCTNKGLTIVVKQLKQKSRIT